MDTITLFVGVMIAFAFVGVVFVIKRFMFGVGLLLVGLTGVFAAKLMLTAGAAKIPSKSEDPGFVAFITQGQWVYPVTAIGIFLLLGLLFLRSKPEKKEKKE